jgi:hypothetical protein
MVVTIEAAVWPIVLMIICEPLLIVREHGEALFELLKFTPWFELVDVLTNSPYSNAFARYCSGVNLQSLPWQASAYADRS